MRKICSANGPCKITVIDKETGEVLLEEEGHIVSFSERISSSPIHVMGVFDPIETHYRRDLSVNFALFPSYERVEHSNKECNHQWVTYEGVVDKYDYCRVCDKKKEL